MNKNTPVEEIIKFLRLDIEQTKELLSGDLKKYTNKDLESIRATLLHEEVTLQTLTELVG